MDKQKGYDNIINIERAFFSRFIKQVNRFQHLGNYTNVYDAVLRGRDNINDFVDGNNDDINIFVEFDLADKKLEYGVDRMFLGTNLRARKSLEECEVSYSITLQENNIYKARLHFDHDFGSNTREKKPSSHIQSGGRLPSFLKSENIEWDKKIDKPRWPSLPICTPLLWQTAFQEFGKCASVKSFIQKGEGWWENTVIENEKGLWVPFLDDLSSVFTRKWEFQGKASMISAFYS